MVAAVAVLMSDGCGGDDAGGGDGRHDLGNGVSVVVHDIRDPVPADEDYERTYVLETAEPRRWIAVELEYVNDGDKPVDASLEYGVELHTSAGYEAEGVDLDDLPSVPKMIPPDASMRGWEGFVLPVDAEPAILLLYGEIGDDPVTVELPLD